MHEFTNELIHESSPYLLEHAHNPVNWYPWGEKAFAKAKQENKPVIISIGYSSCHWCHVMEHESFSDISVANYMNAHFIAIKVDREERPDIDQIYMHAATLISGNGGWPLNAFALPDGRPFYAATYFPKDRWLEFLQQVEMIYSTENKKLVEQAESLTEGINKQEILYDTANVSDNFQSKTYNNIFKNWEPIIDYNLGGFARAPKFPLPIGWELLLQHYYITKNENALKAVTSTLNNMAMGGIYDQIGGGFARYSTDKNWKVPHFEKMLYDNGQLISLYAHAYELTKNPLYADIITETLNFIKTEMTNPQGGFYSSLNADSEGVEGKFYVWSKKEIDDILDTKSAKLISDYYQVTELGNWEKEINILHTKQSDSEFAAKAGISFSTFKETLQKSKVKLLTARNQRIKPSTDDKILTSWNALMLKGYIDAYRALGNKEYLQAALANAAFIEKNMFIKDGGIWRNYKNGKANISAFLDDYALLAQAFIELYQVTFNIHWLKQAQVLTDYSINYFFDEKSQLFFYTPNYSKDLISRKMEIPDNVIPSSNSVTAINLFMLGKYFNNTEYTSMAKTMLAKIIPEISNGGPYYANWAILLGINITEIFEIAIMGNEAQLKGLQMQQNYLPTSIFMGGIEENLLLLKMKKVTGVTKIYVCINKTCKLPVDDVQKALDFIQQ